MVRALVSICSFVAMSVAGLVLTASPVSAATITVSTATDVVADDGACSLREAVISANTDTASGASPGECAAGSGADTITPAAGGQIAPLTAGELVITSVVVIEGLNSTVDATDASRVIRVTDAGDLTINDLTITGGNADRGAGIHNEGGAVTLQNVTVTGNSATGTGGGLATDGGTTTVTSSTISSNTATGSGGGMHTSAGAAAVGNTTITSNAATDGAGVAVQGGSVTISESTINTNIATGSGGGIDNAATIVISNSTISGNAATVSGGGVETSGGATIGFTTITDNSAPTGAGIHSGAGTADLAASLVADNTGTGGDADGVPATYVSGGYNVIGDGAATGVFIGSGDTVIGSGAGLGPLAPNGGPTQTHALDPSSAAVDRVTAAVAGDLPTDQRGTSRPQGPAKDAGSFELVCDGVWPVTVMSALEFNEAVTCFNDLVTPGTYEISVDADIVLSGNPTEIDNPAAGVELLISGNGHTFDGSNSWRPIWNKTSVVTLDNATVTRGLADNGGGVWNNAGTLTISNSTITGNAATLSVGRGGGVYNISGDVTVSNSTISGNTARSFGGGIHNDIGTVTLAFTTVARNSAPTGSGTRADGGTIEMGASIVSENDGGGNDLSAPSTGNYVTGGYNVVGDGDTGAFTGPGDVIDASEAGLEDLADNGGPTMTHALAPGSPALDRVTAPVGGDPAIDQRGVVRPQGPAKDTGAVEAAQAGPLETCYSNEEYAALESLQAQTGLRSPGVTQQFVTASVGAYVLGFEPANVTPPAPSSDVCVVSPNWGPNATPYLESATHFWGTSPADAQKLSVLLAAFLAGGS